MSKRFKLNTIYKDLRNLFNALWLWLIKGWILGLISFFIKFSLFRFNYQFVTNLYTSSIILIPLKKIDYPQDEILNNKRLNFCRTFINCIFHFPGDNWKGGSLYQWYLWQYVLENLKS